MLNTSLINWQKVDGLLPVIVQHAQTGQVLMLGYMNDEALAKTINEGKVTFYSRTKQRLWTKGETSGHFLNVVDMSLDCDNDTLLILANPIGATCHTGEDSCFHQFTQQATSHWTWFAQLEQHLAEKKKRRSSQLLHRDAARQRHKKNCSKGRRRSGRNGASGRFAR